MESMDNLSFVSKKSLDRRLHERQHTSFDFKANFARLMDGNFEGMSELDKKVAMIEADEHGHKMKCMHSPEFFPNLKMDMQ